MKIIFAVMATPLTAISLVAAPIIPVDQGMTWNYRMTNEAGEEYDFPNLPPEAQGRIQTQVAYRIAGTEKVDGKDLLKFEMHRDGVVTNTDLVTVDDRAIKCWQRIGLKGQVTKLKPPQLIVTGPLASGTTWDFDQKLGDQNVHQHYAVLGEEEVAVPAGKFRAFHIHGEQRSPNLMTIDRWFVKNTGIIKDVTTTRNSDGDVINRISLELLEQPKINPRPDANMKLLSGSVGKDATGEAVAQFDGNTETIFARWRGRGLPKNAEIRIVWTAENIGDVDLRDYTIDQATATAPAPDSRGVATLSRPESGWVPGDYRVDFYVGDDLADTVKLKITH